MDDSSHFAGERLSDAVVRGFDCRCICVCRGLPFVSDGFHKRADICNYPIDDSLQTRFIVEGSLPSP